MDKINGDIIICTTYRRLSFHPMRNSISISSWLVPKWLRDAPLACVISTSVAIFGDTIHPHRIFFPGCPLSSTTTGIEATRMAEFHFQHGSREETTVQTGETRRTALDESAKATQFRLAAGTNGTRRQVRSVSSLFNVLIRLVFGHLRLARLLFLPFNGLFLIVRTAFRSLLPGLRMR